MADQYYLNRSEADKRVEGIQSIVFDEFENTIYDDIFVQKHTTTSPWNGEQVEDFYCGTYYYFIENFQIKDPHENELFKFACADFLKEAHKLPHMEDLFCEFTADEITDCENYLIEEYGLGEYADKIKPEMWKVNEIDINEDGETELLISLYHYVNLKGTFVFVKNDDVECVGVFDAEEELFDPEGITRYNGSDGQFWFAWNTLSKGGGDEFSDHHVGWLIGTRLYKIDFDGENLSAEMLLSQKYIWDDKMYDIIGNTYWIGDKEVTESEYGIERRKYITYNIWDGGSGGSIGFDLKYVD